MLRLSRFLAHLGRPAALEFRPSHPVSFDPSRLKDHILPRPEDFGSLYFKLRNTFMNPMLKVHPFMVLCHARSESPEYMQHFGLDHGNEGLQLFFTILHVWIIHRGFHKNKLETRKLLLWEYLWARFRDLLVLHDIAEDNFEYNLVEMQNKTLGFCLALDESFDFYYHNADHTTLKKMIVVYFYNNDQSIRDSEKVERLAFYTIMLESFIKQLPTTELKFALFVWPEFNFGRLMSSK